MESWMVIFGQIIYNLNLLEDELPETVRTIEVREDLGKIATEMIHTKMHECESEELIENYMYDLVDLKKKLDIATKQERLM